ncbi:hypothetical protein BJ875DRAFT_458556 [Amylocarpus encephaloides]|uniref:Uncharacterized protein n=1 Tax=Amylocarpus encephaloides TaxID=45428 RepID=A0A9P7YLD3_9HELO|nr:hypothetical protein BJ875DRAFT_458556 [Amylocarpus encephaloides]
MFPTKHHKRSVTFPSVNSTTALLTGEDSITNLQPSLSQRIATWWIYLCAPANPSSNSPTSHTEPLVHRYTVVSKSTPNLLLKQEWVERNILAGPSYQRSEDAFRDADEMVCASTDELSASVLRGRARAWSSASGEQTRIGGRDRPRFSDMEEGGSSAMTASYGTLNSDFVVVGPPPKADSEETKGYGKRPSGIIIPRTSSQGRPSTRAILRQKRVPCHFEAFRTPRRNSTPGIPSPHFEPTMTNHSLFFKGATHDPDEGFQEAIDDSLPRGSQGEYWRRPYPNSSILSIEFGDPENESSFGSLTGMGEWGESSTTPEGNQLRQPVVDHESAREDSGMDSYLRMDSFLRNLPLTTGEPEDPEKPFRASTLLSVNNDAAYETTGSEKRLEDSLQFVMDGYLEQNLDMVDSGVVEDLTTSGLEETLSSEPPSRTSLLTPLIEFQGMSTKSTEVGAGPLSQSPEPKIARPVHLSPCSLESSQSSNSSSISLTSGPDAEWWCGTRPISTDHVQYDRWRDYPLPDSRPLGPRLGLRGGAGKPDSLDLLFGIRRPVGDVEAGRKLLDQPVGLLWYVVGGRNMQTTYREAMKMTQERVEIGNELEREKEEKKEQKAKKKEEEKKADEANPKPRIVDKIKRLLKTPKDKGKAPETNNKPEDQAAP